MEQLKTQLRIRTPSSRSHTDKSKEAKTRVLHLVPGPDYFCLWFQTEAWEVHWKSKEKKKKRWINENQKGGLQEAIKIKLHSSLRTWKSRSVLRNIPGDVYRLLISTSMTLRYIFRYLQVADILVSAYCCQNTFYDSILKKRSIFSYLK